MSLIALRVKQFLAAAESLGRPLFPGARILELGCGAGSMTQAFRDQGWDAHGADFVFREGPGREAMLAAGALHIIPSSPYRLPFEDNSFDLVISSQVFEHVMDFPATFRELARVQKSDAIGIHVFPSRHRVLEIHTAIPFGGAWQRVGWIGFWSLFVRRLPSARALSFSKRKARLGAYLAENVNYVPHSKLRHLASASFDRAELNAWAFLQHSPLRGRKMAMQWIPGRSQLLGTFFEQTLILSSPK